MTRGQATAIWLLLSSLDAFGEHLQPQLSNGVISYSDEHGRRTAIDVERKCTDLWVSPDESAIAFIAIEKAEPATAQEIEPFIEESSIYIARKSEHFKPVRVEVRVTIDRRTWTVFRQPSISPDLHTVYFSVPYTMTSWKLLSTSTRGGSYSIIGDADSYCVIWGGKDSGELLMQIRREADAGDLNPGANYPCYARNRSGVLTKIANEAQCDGFVEFVAKWSRQHGGSCRPSQSNRSSTP